MKKSLIFGFTSLVFLGFAASAYAETPAAVTPVSDEASVAAPTSITNEEPEDAEFPPATCQPGYWELSGAGFLTNQKTAFNPEWVPVLENFAACLSHPGMVQACVSVQGR
ncbi:hypothetical protein KAI87_02025, partial [Myxococcota bacterium]|nr:hypothetical protein [Myxococcota bacterium]